MSEVNVIFFYMIYHGKWKYFHRQCKVVIFSSTMSHCTILQYMYLYIYQYVLLSFVLLQSWCTCNVQTEIVMYRNTVYILFQFALLQCMFHVQKPKRMLILGSLICYILVEVIATIFENKWCNRWILTAQFRKIWALFYPMQNIALS